MPSCNIQPLNFIHDFANWKEMVERLTTNAFNLQLYDQSICLVRLVQLLNMAFPDRELENQVLEEIRVKLGFLGDDEIGETIKEVLLKACHFIHTNIDNRGFTLQSLLHSLKDHEPTMKDSIILGAQEEGNVDFQIEERGKDETWSDILVYYRPEGCRLPNYHRYRIFPFEGRHVDLTLIGAIDSRGRLFTFGTRLNLYLEEIFSVSFHSLGSKARTINSSGPRPINYLARETTAFNISATDAIYIYRYDVELNL